MKTPFRPSTLLIQAIALLAAAASCLRAQSPIGAGPYYQFDVAGKTGAALDTGEVISNNYYPSDTTLEAIPDHFAMNDAGDILAPHKVAKQSDAVLRTAVALYHQTVPIVITRGGYGLGGISDNGTVFLGNEIFYRDAYKTDATGYISQVILNPDGSFKDSPPRSMLRAR